MWTKEKAMTLTMFLLRVVAGYLFLANGTAKLLHVPHIPAFDGLPLVSLIGIAGLLELVGGALLILGLFTRPAAFLVAGEMAVAYFMGHASQGNLLLPLMNDGQPAVLFCFIFLFFAAHGAGPWSLDAKRGRAASATSP